MLEAKMSEIDDRIAQCKRDKETVERNLRELEEQKIHEDKQYQFKAGDVALSMGGEGGSRLIIELDGQLHSIRLNDSRSYAVSSTIGQDGFEVWAI